MSSELHSHSMNWYSIRTKPKEESRAALNLQAWRVETFTPLIRERRCHPFTGQAIHVVKPLFSRYIFARFSGEMAAKIRYTRGVQAIVGYGDDPSPINDEIIQMIKDRTENGFVKLADDFAAGDAVRITDGPLKNFDGAFVRRTKSADRVTILLNIINYQAQVEVTRDMLTRVNHAAPGH